MKDVSFGLMHQVAEAFIATSEFVRSADMHQARCMAHKVSHSTERRCPLAWPQYSP